MKGENQKGWAHRSRSFPERKSRIQKNTSQGTREVVELERRVVGARR